MLKTKQFDVNGNSLQITEFNCREGMRLFSYTVKYFAGTFGALVKTFTDMQEQTEDKQQNALFFNNIIICLQTFAKDIDPENMEDYVVQMLRKSVYKNQLVTDKNFAELFGSDWDAMIRCVATSITFNFGDFFLNLVNTLKEGIEEQIKT